VLVYGDPSFQESLSLLCERVCFSLERCANVSPGVDRLRATLIEAGQFEQAVSDNYEPESEIRVQAENITLAIAGAFIRAWWQIGDPHQKVLDALSACAKLKNVPAQSVTVKVPEGFAFYTLFPEQYSNAALEWASKHTGNTDVLVVGLRSIGTTLSAVVAATLQERGYKVRRMTVRPRGHPFGREILVKLNGNNVGAALIVDEGPGLSGSSIAAAAEALERAGISAEKIAFFPGHSGLPGAAASAEVLARWRRTPRFVGDVRDLEWNNRSLTEALAERTESILGWGVTEIQDLSAGNWRRYCYEVPEQWPAVCAPFECTKYRCVLENGFSVLWKFQGWSGVPEYGRCGADLALSRLERRAALGWTPKPLGQHLGFVAQRWCEDPPILSDPDDPRRPDELAQIGAYIHEAAGLIMSPLETDLAFARVREMLEVNTREALGDDFASRAVLLGSTVRGFSAQRVSAAGDGRMGPWEWRRNYTGAMIKLDAAGHDTNHTIVGRQPVWWDLAGVVVEWDLKPEELFLVQATAMLESVAPELLAFYVAAYAAFRTGQCRFCIGVTGDPRERERLERAADSYQLRLQHTLGDGILARLEG